MGLMNKIKDAHYYLGALYYLQSIIKSLGMIVLVFMGGLYFLYSEEYTIALLLLALVLILSIVIIVMYITRVRKTRQSTSNKKLHITYFESTYDCKELTNEYSAISIFEVCAKESQVDSLNLAHSFSGSGREKVSVEPREFFLQNQQNRDDGNFQISSIMFPRQLEKNEKMNFSLCRKFRGGKTKPKRFFIHHVNDIYPNGIILRVRLDQEVEEFTKEILPSGLTVTPIRQEVVKGKGLRQIEWVIEKPCVALRYKIAWRCIE
jgi:hypothetical protein